MGDIVPHSSEPPDDGGASLEPVVSDEVHTARCARCDRVLMKWRGSGVPFGPDVTLKCTRCKDWVTLHLSTGD